MLKRLFKYVFGVLIISSVVSCKKNTPDFPPSLATLNTVTVSSITDSSAMSGGNIISDGNTNITARGICYSTKVNPTIKDTIVKYTGSANNFTLNIKGLSPNTTYYIRAYVTNSIGTAYGTNEEIFTTQTSLATIITSTVSSITGTSAICACDITNEGGNTIILRGICYSTSQQPTTKDSIISSNMATDTFSVNLTSLTPKTTYYVRSFATNSAGTAYGTVITFTTPTQVFAFGQTYQGGIIFYIDDSGIHGLVAAPSDQSTNTVWGCYGSLIGVSDSTVGTGAQNTANIIAGCSSGSAASFCTGLTLGGYNNWFLPSKEELVLMYQNLFYNGFGNFSSNSSYWSSTEYNANNSWSLNFTNNTQHISSKNSPYSVRAIRAF